MEPLWSPVVSSETSETPKKTRARTHHRRRYRTRKPMQQPTQVKITSSVPVEPGTLLRIPSATRSASRSGTAACASASSLTSPVVDLNDVRAIELAGGTMRAGIPPVGPTGEKRAFHSFRHTHAKVALETGRQLIWLSRRLGHSSLKVTSDVYGPPRRCAQRGTRRPPEPDTDRPRESDTRGRDKSARGCSRRCRVRGGGQPTWSRSSRHRG